ncbi:F-box/kelch-repeat protein At1g22040 [Punica granatum]|uniref:F-box/kelch-repeat protein At1g22040 n=2 Tax=Punica granatum TaxID=22663 RepID=A0A6P8DJ28_PUNGR|nr:F-box/kelch-repeat protein At1g22040 [Punica granatum]PKI63339.1 hypothetical protein CRG98_016227 [Punica granatum]
MGSILSLNNPKSKEGESYEVRTGDNCKRQRLSSSSFEENTRLIPNLPDEISLQILARIPRIHYLNIKAVSRSWKNAVTGSELYSLRKELGTSEEWLYILMKVDEDRLLWYGLDPLSRKWQRLPLMPMVSLDDESEKGLGSTLRMWNAMGSSIRIADVIRGWLGRKDTMDRMAYCGCSVGAVDGSLYVLGGFARASALASVWRYDSAQNSWAEVSPMLAGRAYCKTGVLDGRLYVVGGVTRGRGGGLAPLQSAEVYDPQMGSWTQLPSMPFSKAQVLPTAFLADLLKPIATGMTSYRGRLFVPQSLYCWPFFVDVGGEVYDPKVGSWDDMPMGMGEGWPARQAGTKLSVTVEGELYSLDPSSSLDSAKIKVYDHGDDAWKVVAEDVPIRDFTDSESPYLLAGLLGKLHVITKDARSNIAVMQADVQHNISPFPSSSSSSASPDSPSLPVVESEMGLWRVIASMSAGSMDLVSCQTLGI